MASVLILVSLPGLSAARADVPPDSGATIILDASDFLDEIPKGHTITDAGRLDVPWIFNNTALVLTKDPAFEEADLRSYEFGDEVALLKNYQIPRASAVKFGDVNGDGRTDFMVLTPAYSAHVFDFDGTALWSYEAPEEGARERASFEAPGALWDLDQDGAAEAIQWRIIDGTEWLVVADGQTGTIAEKTPWPTPPLPHAYNNFRIAIGRLHPGYPDDIVLLTDTGGTITVTAYDARLNRRWQHTESRKKDHLGHYVYPVDLDADGVDEVVAGSLVLDADGRELWNDFDLFYDSKWPGMPLNGNPVFVKGDWKGDGKEAVFWYKFRMKPDGRGELYFGEPVYHMFDFMGDGAEEVITLDGERLKVYGYRGANPQGERAKRSPAYLQHHVTNHSHYS